MRSADVDAGDGERSVAIVHDYLNQCGGAERVVLEMAKLWPQAPIYTSLYRRESTYEEFAGRDIRVTPLDRLPVDQGFRACAPLYPWAFRSLGVLDQDIVVSSSSGWAHGVRTSPDSLHVVYCYTPPRWLYRPSQYMGPSLATLMFAPLRKPLERWDRAAARRPDLYIATCEHVRSRIKSIYGRDAPVVHPPVDVERFTPRPRGERLLVVSRLLRYKRVRLIVEAATRAGIGLDVVGIGPELEELRRIAGPTVCFHGQVDDAVLVELMEGCRSLCVAATEDFGLTPLEANAAGKPVVAFADGGALETLRDGVTGVFFHELTVDSLLYAVRVADDLERDPHQIAASASDFSAVAFRERLGQVVTDAAARRAGQMPAVAEIAA